MREIYAIFPSKAGLASKEKPFRVKFFKVSILKNILKNYKEDLFMNFIPLLALIVIGFSIWGWWTIFSKTGFPRGLAFVWIIPLAGLIVFFIFAFSEWPILKEMKQLKLGTVPVGPVTNCPKCGSTDITKSYIENGGMGDWCPHCQESIQKMRGEI